MSIIKRLITYRPSRPKPLKTANFGYLLDTRAFLYAMECERMRVDRNGSPLAIVILTLKPKNKAPELLQKLAEVLEQRLRITDTCGQLKDGRIGILLPDTFLSGAKKVVDELYTLLGTSLQPEEYDIVMYPDDSHITIDKKANSAHTASEKANKSVLSEEAVMLFSKKTPVWKRSLDIVGAATGLLLTSPIIAAAAVAVRMTSDGPVFFVQEREGIAGRKFHIVKLRTMRVGADDEKHALRKESEQDGPAFKLTDDPRVTKAGKILRKLSIDEFPQFWNVLRGDMSLVGPRPLPTEESHMCSPWQRRRLDVLPGLTCFWQIWGRSSVTFDQWTRMDLDYIRRRSLRCDLSLLAKTLPAVLFTRGAK